MKISYLKDKKNQVIDLNKLILDNSIELNNETDLDALIDKIDDAKYVLLGEASHGTHDYYTWRTKISQKLIEKKGFSFIAVEGDWPDCYRINRYVKHYEGAGKSAFDVLQAFNRWPTWMWANWETVALVEWMRTHNETAKRKVGFYGLDVYSLWESMQAIVDYLEDKDPKTKQMAQEVMKCFEPFGEEKGQAYARASLVLPTLCEEEVINLLIEIRKNMLHYNSDPEALINTEQNTQVIVNAEKYYRAMIHPGPASWNIRDHHMTDTLDRLMKFHGPSAKGIVWEHNTHIGNARATDMIREGMVNVGQLVSEHHQADGVFAIGFGSYKGKVVAGKKWGDVMRIMNVPEAQQGSWEHLIHEVQAGTDSKENTNRIIFMDREMRDGIGDKEFGHRAIGVVYHPENESYGNYVPSRMPYRYDAFIYLEETTALHPLHIKPDGHQMPETYPFGT